MSRWILNQMGTNYSSGAERDIRNKFGLVNHKTITGLLSTYHKPSYAGSRLVLSRNIVRVVEIARDS